MPPRYFCDQRESESQAFRPLCRRSPHESTKYAFALLGRNADTTIFYVQYGQGAVLSNLDADRRRRRRVLEGVANEIVDHALDQRGVGADEETRFDRGVQHSIRACLEKRNACGDEVAEVYDG